jgi:hypothetical protein
LIFSTKLDCQLQWLRQHRQSNIPEFRSSIFFLNDLNVPHPNNDWNDFCVSVASRLVPNLCNLLPLNQHRAAGPTRVMDTRMMDAFR